MRVAVELEFPDDRAAAAFQWLQSLPADVVAYFAHRSPRELPSQPATEELSEAEQQRLLHELFGAWKDGVSGEEMVREIYEARDSGHREVEL
ncbi:MAG: hypothetical protein EOO63_05240 [Hymenobacter sp.]|nr:MAG: hypothetical protein EOO63_05240 [Hymenobacter sp.]